MQGAPVFNFISTEQREIALAKLEKRRSGLREQYEFQLRHKDGSHIWVLISSTPLSDENQQFTGSLVMLSDISRQKSIEAALRQSDERYRAFVAQSSEAIWRFELDAPLDASQSLELQSEHCLRHIYIAECNDAMAQMFGFQNAEQIVDKRLHEILPPTDYNARYMRQFLTSGYRLENAEASKTQPDGRTRHFSTDLIGIQENGTLQRVWGMRRDVTAQKELELQRASLLEQESRARLAAEEARRAAEQAQIEAQSASRAKDEFLATLSHELRTPLSSILGWTLMLQERQMDEKDTLYAVEAIARNAQLQAQLVEDLIDISRITAGRMHIERSEVVVSDVVRAAIQTVFPLSQERQIAIEYSIAPEFGGETVLGDAPRLQQVFWNLLSNAIKFTPQNGRIEIVQKRVAENLHIEIKDSGQGIPLDFLPHVFEAFRQADSSSTRSFGGVGLGLSIVKNIVQLHGGTIEAQSDGEGCGAKFTVKLPLQASQQAPQ